MKFFTGVKKRVVACLVALSLVLSLGLAGTQQMETRANEVTDFLVDQAMDRALGIVCYYVSYGLHAIDDAVDDEEFSQVVSWLDAFIFDTEESRALAEIKEMCEEILEELDTIKERQTEYGQAILGKMDNAQITSAQRYLDQKIDEDINANLKYNGIDTSQVINAYTRTFVP